MGFVPPVFSAPPAEPPRRIRLDALTEAWGILSRDFGTFVGGTIVAMIALLAFSGISSAATSGAAQGPFGMPQAQGPQLLSVAISSIGTVLYVMLASGLQRIALLKLQGRPASIGVMFEPAGMGWMLCGWAAIQAVLAGALGMLAANPFAPHFWILAGPYAVLYFTFEMLTVLVPLLILDGRMSVLAAVSTSVRTVAPGFFMLLLLMVCTSVLAAIGIVAFCVGILFTAPLTFIVPAVVYHDFFRTAEPDPLAGGDAGYYPRG